MIVKRRDGAVLRQLQTLFNVGTIGELSDGQLLERFATDPDEVAELAFSALVERHGALVWRICLAILRDEHDAEDAFQATFLVPVRRKDEILRAIATTQAELGEIQDALATGTVHGDQRLKAEIQTQAVGFQARQGDIAGALRTAERIADAGSKAEALEKIAHAQSRTGQQDVAHDWAAKLSSPQERAMALLGVVEGSFARRRGE